MSTTTAANQILRGLDRLAAPGPVPPEFWELIERYRGELVNQATAILGQPEDAEDVAQETFCEAFRRPERLAEARSLGAWLRTINRANALNRLRLRRQQERNVRGKARGLPERQATTGGFSLLALRESVAQAIEELPEATRQAVVLHYWEHQSAEEIARRLGSSPRTVFRLLREADLLLHERLRPYFGQDAQPTPPGGQP